MAYPDSRGRPVFNAGHRPVCCLPESAGFCTTWEYPWHEPADRVPGGDTYHREGGLPLLRPSDKRRRADVAAGADAGDCHPHHPQGRPGGCRQDRRPGGDGDSYLYGGVADDRYPAGGGAQARLRARRRGVSLEGHRLRGEQPLHKRRRRG